jgi:hypothetical protein
VAAAARGVRFDKRIELCREVDLHGRCSPNHPHTIYARIRWKRWTKSPKHSVPAADLLSTRPLPASSLATVPATEFSRVDVRRHVL